MLAISDCSIREVDTLCLTVLLEFFLINDLECCFYSSEQKFHTVIGT